MPRDLRAAVSQRISSHWADRARELHTHRERLREQLADTERELERTQRTLAKVREEMRRARAGESHVHLPESQAAFMRLLKASRRASVPLRQADPASHDPVHPRRRLFSKLMNSALAASHGLRVAEPLAVWDRRIDIDLAGLPDAFVVKSSRGAGSRGVLPLHRVAPGRYERADGERMYSTEEVVEQMGDRRLSGPFFAEELLRPSDGNPLPDDVKFYCCYGRVVHGMIRRVERHGDDDSASFRYLDADGRDVAVSPREPSMQVRLPERYDEMVQWAQLLSRVAPVPFLRVDLYPTVDGIVFGELTLLPGGDHGFIAEHEGRLGREWEAAQIRLELDLASGSRPFAMVPGTHPVPDLLAPWLPAVPADHDLALAAVRGETSPARDVPAPE